MNKVVVEIRVVNGNEIINSNQCYSCCYEPNNANNILDILQSTTQKIAEANSFIAGIKQCLGSYTVETVVRVERENGQTIDEFSGSIVKHAKDLVTALLTV